MNKYQDIQYRHGTSKSFAILPTIRMVSSQFLYIKQRKSVADYLSIDHLIASQKPEDYTPKSKSSRIESLRKPQSISEFSIRQNEILGSCLYKDSEHQEPLRFPEITPKSKPTDQDFSKLIDNINNIITPKTVSKPYTIKPKEPLEMTIDQNQIKYCKIIMKLKKAPLAVKIYRLRGKVVTYTSPIITEPGPSQFDKYYPLDYFEIRDNSSHFKYETIYLGIKALEDSDIRVTISFGRNTSSLQQLKRIKRELSSSIMEQFDELDKEQEEERKSIPRETKISKDYVQENKNPQLKSSFMKASELVARGEIWRLKREEVLERKKALLQLKKHKAIESLNRQEIKQEKEKVLLKELQDRQIQGELEGKWLCLVYFSIMCSNMRELVKSEKEKRLRKVSIVLKARQIQSFLKTYNNHLPPEELLRIRAKNTLLLYRSTVKSVMTQYIIEPQLVSSISGIAHAHIIFHTFATYFTNIIRIQRSVMKYQQVKNRRVRRIVKLWDESCQQMLFVKGSNRKIRKKESVSLILIPKSIRDSLIKDYYRDCLLNFREKLRKRSAALGTLAKNKLFQTAVSLMCDYTIPPFDFIPSSKELRLLIEKAKSCYRTNNY